MHIVVNELPIEQALAQARRRFEEADRRLAGVLTAGSGLAWAVLGALVMAGGFLGLSGAFPLSVGSTPAMGVPLALGGAFLGHGLPEWMRARRERRRRSREWHHALELLELREQQAREDPGLTVEVLDRHEGPPALDGAAWKTAMTAAAGRYVQ